MACSASGQTHAMRITGVARNVGDSRAVAEVALCGHGIDRRRGAAVLLAQVLGANILCREDADERRRVSRLLDVWTTLRFLALDQANDSDHVEAELACGSDRL